MKSILILCPEFQDSTSLYRAAGPFSQLRKEMDLSLQVYNQVGWANLMICDVVFSLRPHTPEHFKILMMAKNLNKPVWIDFDDDITSVPNSNPASKIFNTEKIQSSIRGCLSLADIVTVSTSYLKSKLSQWNENIHIVPNAIDNETFFKVGDWDQEYVVLWRGSPTHDEDLAQYTKSMVQVAKAHPKTQFYFMGNPYWWTLDQMPKVNTKSIPPVGIHNYLDTISAMNPSVMQVPLKDNLFNRSKSNIAHLEGCFAGAVTLAPAWEEWMIPGVVNYKDSEDYQIQLENLITMDTNEIFNQASDGWKYIEEHLTLKKVNRLRKNILISLLS